MVTHTAGDKFCHIVTEIVMPYSMPSFFRR
jgi:hypothetical protein